MNRSLHLFQRGWTQASLDEVAFSLAVLSVAALLLAALPSPATAQVYPYDPSREATSTERFAPSDLSASPSAAAERGLRLYAAGAFAEAVTALEPLITGGTASADVYAVYVAALLRSGRPDVAVLAAESGTDAHPLHAGLHLLRGKALIQTDDPEPALEAYRKTAALVEEGHPLPPGIDADTFQDEWGRVHLIVGSQALKRGAFRDAEARFLRAKQLMHDPAPAMTQQVYLYFEEGKMEDAARLASRALEQTPDAVDLLQIQAQALYEVERYDQLVPIYQRLYELRPDDVDIGLAYGQALLLDEQSQSALAVFQNLLARFPKEQRVYETLVGLYRRSLNYQRAVQVIDRQQTHFPDDDTLPWKKAELYEQMGELDSARVVYDSLASAHPTQPKPMLAAARTLVSADSTKAALDRYRSMIRDFPNDVEVRATFATVLEKEASLRPTLWPEVREAYRFLSEDVEGSDKARALVGLSTALEAMARTDSARTTLAAALRADPSNARANYRTAILSDEQEKRFRHAETALRQALRNVEVAQGLMTGSINKSGFGSPSVKPLAERTEEANDLAADVFTFFGENFPLEQTEPVILDVMETYDASGRLLYLTGRYYEAHDRDADALRYFERATQEAPNLRDAHLALGAQHETARRTRAAILSYERALGADEQHPDAYRALIRLYRTQDRLDVLVRRWQSRLRATPQNDVLREHLVDALHRTGRHDDARAIAARNDG
jgi:tetratricopeptide (TPR) repeat protein